ncbi:MAG TPA: hypothetical protein VMN36_11205 [Verrucomicrobiales bacterium]|nr:hypothetical protein [Verrucomicrobiales bacterium]
MSLQSQLLLVSFAVAACGVALAESATAQASIRVVDPQSRVRDLPSSGLIDFAPRVTSSTLQLLPAKPDFRIFTAYDKSGKGRWNPAWKFDFSGVCWSSSRAGTVIGDRHVVCASHYITKQNPEGFAYAAGATLTFTGIDGNPVRRRIVARGRATGRYRHDVGCFLLDRDLPPEIRRYRLLRLDARVTLHGAQAIRTRFHGKEASVVTLNHPSGDKRRPDPEYPFLDYRVPKNRSWKGKTLQRGDSGHPVFIFFEGEPCLVSTHSLPAMGPSYLSPDVIDSVLRTFRRLESRSR